MNKFILPVLILLLPTYQIRWVILSIPFTLLEITILLSVCLCVALTPGTLLYRLRYFATLERKQLRFAIAFFVGATTFAAVTSPTTIPAAGIWKAYVIEPILVFYIVGWTVHTKTFSWVWITNAVALLLTVIGGASIAQWFGLLPVPSPLWAASETFRATSIFPYPNAVALLVGPLLPIVLSRRSILSWVGFFLGATALFLSDSTAGMLATASGVIVFLSLNRHSGLARIRSWIATVGMASLAMTLLIIITVRSESLNQKLQFQTHSGILRRQQYTETRQLLRDHPFMGGGLANYQQAIAPYHNTKKSGEPLLYPHNFFLAVWSEFGLLGLVAMTWILILVGRSLVQAYRRDHSTTTAGLIAAWAILLAHGLVDVPYFKNDLAVLFWILVGMSTISKNLIMASAVFLLPHSSEIRSDREHSRPSQKVFRAQ